MKRVSFALLSILLLVTSSLARHAPDPNHAGSGPVDPRIREAQRYIIDRENRVHRAGAMWMNITNWGYFGNYGIDAAQPVPMEDPEFPGTWAPQCEYPGGSEVQYLYQGSLWLGALIQDEGFQFPRVSTGAEGWVFPRIHEFQPGEEPSPIEERSVLPNKFNRLGEFVSHPDAVSEQDFIATYMDTLTDPDWVETDGLDGPHYPLGIKITQTSYSWSYAYARDFIIIDWEIENIADNYLKNLYVGLYVDADVGANWEQFRSGAEAGHTDDVCGFQQFYYFENAAGDPDSSVINTAWIADNDGRPTDVAAGNDYHTPHVTGVRVVRAPNPKLKTSFNWWVSHGTAELDFGPAWAEDESEGNWTATYGTPLGDSRKYFILSNREFDYDQVFVNQPEWIAEHPQPVVDPQGNMEEKRWKEPNSEVADDVANGYDTRYLLSWGPLGIFDHVNDAGERIYRLNPGERFSMTIAYVAGQNFHDQGRPQESNQVINPDLYDFADFRYNADWAAKVYDNPMIDTNGDGWYGEDTGLDLLYAEAEGDSVIIDGTFIGIYPGPDEGERDESLQPEEDTNPYKPKRYEYTSLNDMLDPGDGEPDFQGPPPPPVPAIENDPTMNDVVLRWTPEISEDPEYVDPFSRLQDFEGYRIYTSATGLEADYSFIAQYDRIDYAYYALDRDSMMTVPVTDTTGMSQDTMIQDVRGVLKPVGENIGMADIWNEETGYYEYRFDHARPMMPRWYAVTTYDYGDPKSGTPPLESSKSANAIYVAPSGDPAREPRVVPNPYRADQDYTVVHGDGLAWENRDDGTLDFFPQTDRRMWFYNLPRKCVIRIFTISGDLVQIIPHNTHGDNNSTEALEFAESWDLNSRNKQQVVSGLYYFSVEDMTAENKGDVHVSKFVIIR